MDINPHGRIQYMLFTFDMTFCKAQDMVPLIWIILKCRQLLGTCICSKEGNIVGDGGMEVVLMIAFEQLWYTSSWGGGEWGFKSCRKWF